jgi:TDG/mug DNA glycosylase family protein
VPDIIGPDLKVLFCGINPSVYSAAVGHHFARPGNRFWPTLHGAGFTDHLLSPGEDRSLLDFGLGCTNLVARATAQASELDAGEIERGAGHLLDLIRRHRPRWLAVLGLGAYRQAFGDPLARVGRQERSAAGAGVWLLPNPSGLNAHYQLADLVAAYGELRRASD